MPLKRARRKAGPNALLRKALFADFLPDAPLKSDRCLPIRRVTQGNGAAHPCLRARRGRTRRRRRVGKERPDRVKPSWPKPGWLRWNLAKLMRSCGMQDWSATAGAREPGLPDARSFRRKLRRRSGHALWSRGALPTEWSGLRFPGGTKWVGCGTDSAPGAAG